MSKVKTHTGIVITSEGEKTVRLNETATTWSAGKNEYYYKDTGKRGGAAGVRRRLVLTSIKPIAEKQ
ncbi:hypothetical protein [Atlantibacter sp.]|uniref:hypothetical protein n=1 Tax=Atlantibacter sp. TaxID=1903473 RepID=UPI00289753D9|nr:hypothetical protein [Atlantibacter sp.]